MERLFLPYALSLIAKEKGFNEKCIGIIGSNFGPFLCDDPEQIHQSHPDKIPAPLYQQISDWLREEYDIVLEIRFGGRGSGGFGYWGCKIYKSSNGLRAYVNNPDLTKNNDLKDYSYYEALDVAIEKAFELI